MKILFATFWNSGMVANMRVKEYMLLGIVVDYSMHASTLTLFPHLHTHVHREWWWCWCLHHWHVSWDDMLQTSPVLARYCMFVTLLVALSHLNTLNCFLQYVHLVIKPGSAPTQVSFDQVWRCVHIILSYLLLMYSGIDITHPDFGGRAVWGYDAVDSPSRRTDGNGHGTHVAG